MAAGKHRNCPSCGHPQVGHKGEREDVYGKNHTIQIYRCGECGWTNDPIA